MTPITGTPRLRTLALVQLVALGVLIVSVLVLGWFAVSTQYALCAFKHDLEARAAANQEILDQEKDPIIRAFGLRIPRTVIQSNLRGQRATLRSLDGLYC